MQQQEMIPGKDFGALPTGAEFTKVETMERIPSLVPAKPGFEAGAVIYGKYLRSRVVVSDKFVNDSGTRILHEFESLTANSKGEYARFGIWGVGSLDATLPRIARGTALGVRYVGLADKPIKKGHNAPHVFEYLSLGGAPLNIDWSAKPLLDSVQAKDDELSDAATESE